MWKRPNPLKAATITIKGSGPSLASQVPEGIVNPKTYVAAAKFLNDVAANEIQYGCNPDFTDWQEGGPEVFKEEFKKQFQAYSQGDYPFSRRLEAGESVRTWWEKFLGTQNAGLIAVSMLEMIAIRELTTVLLAGGRDQDVLDNAAFHS